MKKFYVQTFGCQMNVYDSELMKGLLSVEGYLPAQTIKEADIILLNTCAIRQHAEERVFGRLRELKKLKEEKPEIILGICGCIAQEQREKLFDDFPFINLIVGTKAYRRLPQIIEKYNSDHLPQLEISDEETFATRVIPQAPLSALVAIMEGCSNYCAYCIVPYVRGVEKSRRCQEILEEISHLAGKGTKEVMLIGQNVNSYRDREIGFSQLLPEVEKVAKIERVRFTTSHPRDIDEDLLKVISNSKKICEHLHLPLQTGSNRILKAMNRGYSFEKYHQIVERIRELIPDPSITTDLIVGFPGETEKDFQETLMAVQKIQFDSAYTFKFSPKIGTKAAEMSNQISEEDKQRRLQELIAVQEEITKKKNQEMIGKTVEVLVEGESRRGNGQFKGRTRTNKTVVFHPVEKNDLIRKLLMVKIEEAGSHTLFGTSQRPPP
ncbi:MAG: tRNA (N6-isopentenyl adenosine(37)-C2)-methylthiotransferase MiaB [Candidatus Edwardsbacteria bacterium]